MVLGFDRLSQVLRPASGRRNDDTAGAILRQLNFKSEQFSKLQQVIKQQTKTALKRITVGNDVASTRRSMQFAQFAHDRHCFHIPEEVEGASTDAFIMDSITELDMQLNDQIVRPIQEWKQGLAECVELKNQIKLLKGKRDHTKHKVDTTIRALGDWYTKPVKPFVLPWVRAEYERMEIKLQQRQEDLEHHEQQLNDLDIAFKQRLVKLCSEGDRIEKGTLDIFLVLIKRFEEGILAKQQDADHLRPQGLSSVRTRRSGAYAPDLAFPNVRYPLHEARPVIHSCEPSLCSFASQLERQILRTPTPSLLSVSMHAIPEPQAQPKPSLLNAPSTHELDPIWKPSSHYSNPCISHSLPINQDVPDSSSYTPVPLPPDTGSQIPSNHQLPTLRVLSRNRNPRSIPWLTFPEEPLPAPTAALDYNNHSGNTLVHHPAPHQSPPSTLAVSAAMPWQPASGATYPQLGAGSSTTQMPRQAILTMGHHGRSAGPKTTLRLQHRNTSTNSAASNIPNSIRTDSALNADVPAVPTIPPRPSSSIGNQQSQWVPLRLNSPLTSYPPQQDPLPSPFDEASLLSLQQWMPFQMDPPAPLTPPQYPPKSFTSHAFKQASVRPAHAESTAPETPPCSHTSSCACKQLIHVTAY